MNTITISGTIANIEQDGKNLIFTLHNGSLDYSFRCQMYETLYSSNYEGDPSELEGAGIVISGELIPKTEGQVRFHMIRVSRIHAIGDVDDRVNIINVIGRVTGGKKTEHEPEGVAVSVRHFDETRVANFNIALNSFLDGEKLDCYFQVSAWGKTCDTAEQYLVKGKQVGITGSLRVTKGNTGGKFVSINTDPVGGLLLLADPAESSNGTYGDPPPRRSVTPTRKPRPATPAAPAAPAAPATDEPPAPPTNFDEVPFA